MRSVIIFICFVAFATPSPTKRPDISSLLAAQDVNANSINVEEMPTKKVTLSTTPTPLGSQLAVGSLFPERAGLETGHRIPLHLFPIETQNKILEIEEVTTKDPEKYVDSSSFRRSRPSSIISPPSFPVSHDDSLRGLFGLDTEGDKAYDSSLRIFAPPSFF
eukprot:TRINITY_DN2355_c0_g1_i6.p1 TRINITY_DN2355_c0_g1~~TRINITY_DN2355_c0_g1_i6.p1  ORF type:complete len:162 (-),score=42.85 TRINITY_DN2355_c0_g1_i6:74-559(-)